MKRALFICSQNRLRSPTAEQIFAGREGLEVASAGLEDSASTPVSGELLEWAELIFLMERSHLNELSRKFRPYLKNKHIICLDIPDNYEFMDPVLVRLLELKAGPFLGVSQ